jgi:hypothetical protein
MTTGRTLLLTAILFGFLGLFQFSTVAQDNHSRYLIMENQFVFERVNELPYELLGPMCWNETEGWCDEGMEQAGHRLFYLIDFETERHGVVMQNDTGCWIWWFRPEYGIDNNPHIEAHSWITCPA